MISEIPVFYSDGRAKYYSDGSRAYVKAGKYGSVYRCYFLADDGDTAIQNMFKPGNFARSQTFDIKEGAYENVSNKYYWRYVENVGDNYIDLSIDYCDEGSDIPAVGDVVVQLGDTSDADYQSAIILNSYGSGSPSITLYQGINDFSLDGKDIFEIVDKDQDQHVLLGVFLLHRRRKEIVLGVVVDHGLCQDLVLAVPAGGAELALHECRDLVHVQVDIWNILRLYIVDPGDALQDAVQHVLCVNCHKFTTSINLLYSIENQMTRAVRECFLNIFSAYLF